MIAAASVLLAVATELAEQAKSSMPKMKEGEKILHEWYKNGIYYRETAIGDEVFQSQYDFRKRKSHREAVAK